MNILGISAYYHDSAAALVKSGSIIAAAQEERFTRKKHDATFPKNAIAYVLEEAKIPLRKLDYIVFYEKPLITFERLLETYIAYAPQGFYSFVSAMTVWLKEKLYLKTILKKELARLDNCKVNQLPPLLFTEHHQSHVASAFFPSPFENAAILCLDAVGEWATTSLWLGESNKITPKWELHFPHSLGLLYSAFTYYTGFKVNSGEYKLMGLAPYGEPRYFNLILENLIDIKTDGSFRLNMKYFNYATGLKMISNKFSNLFGHPPRKAENKITQHEMDIAASIQKVTEEVILRLTNTAYQELKIDNLCLAGGVALNCVANGKISEQGKFKNIWIQPAAGDAGGAVGAALAVWYQYLDNQRYISNSDMMQGSYLGPQFDDDEVREYLDNVKAKYDYFIEEDNLLNEVASILSKGYVVGWFQGRMEFGPRALGNRSILGDPRNREMQSIMNLKIKYRESFRPFAPSVLTEKTSKYFELEKSSDYMLLVAKVKKELHVYDQEKTENLFGIDKLKAIRSTIPAVTHVDYSARVQTVNPTKNSRYYKLIKQFEALTGCGVLINTSFNVRGEPIVCTPEDAYRCFMRTEMDYLIINNYILKKVDQNQWKNDKSWQNEFELD